MFLVIFGEHWASYMVDSWFYNIASGSVLYICLSPLVSCHLSTVHLWKQDKTDKNNFVLPSVIVMFAVFSPFEWQTDKLDFADIFW